MDGEALLAACIANHRDETARLVLADWLEEFDSPELADKMRGNSGEWIIAATQTFAAEMGREPCRRMLWAVAFMLGPGCSSGFLIWQDKRRALQAVADAMHGRPDPKASINLRPGDWR